jgi:hypothetical protein
MSGVVFSRRSRPDDVADALEVWVRVRTDADVGARMLARRLARTCRVLAAMQAARLIDENWEAAWERARMEATALLAPGVNAPIDADLPELASERITLTDLGSCPDRVTPILPRGVVEEPPAISVARVIGSVRLARVANG